MYTIINLLVILPVLALSFDKKVHFYSYFKPLFKSIVLVGTLFLLWDYVFTLHGVWGFNPKYLSGIYFFNLPLGEVLFFVTVPYACLFIDACYHEYIGVKMNKWVILSMITIYLILYLLFVQDNFGWYSLSNLFYFTILIFSMYINHPKLLYSFFPSFLISLVPFFIVNGILTGTGLEEEIVWYRENQFSGVRMFTIPYEDILYSFNLLMSVKFVMKKFQNKSNATA